VRSFATAPTFVGVLRDSFRMRASVGRLSPQSALMMWDSPSAGTTGPCGKGAVMGSVLGQLRPAIRKGLLRVWVRGKPPVVVDDAATDSTGRGRTGDISFDPSPLSARSRAADIALTGRPTWVHPDAWPSEDPEAGR
jgi:hypothetical protein